MVPTDYTILVLQFGEYIIFDEFAVINETLKVPNFTTVKESY